MYFVLRNTYSHFAFGRNAVVYAYPCLPRRASHVAGFPHSIPLPLPLKIKSYPRGIVIFNF